MKWIIRTKSGLFCIQFNFEVLRKEDEKEKFTQKRIKHFCEGFFIVDGKVTSWNFIGNLFEKF